MSARRYNLPAQIDQQIRPNFRVREFICRCGGHHDHVLICDRLLDFLQAIHNAVGSPVNITSGHPLSKQQPLVCWLYAFVWSRC